MSASDNQSSLEMTLNIALENNIWQPTLFDQKPSIKPGVNPVKPFGIDLPALLGSLDLFSTLDKIFTVTKCYKHIYL